jgi:hypothetical protein
VVDADSAIYVIGGSGWDGNSDPVDLQDVWASTDGGARQARSRGVGGGYSRVY